MTSNELMSAAEHLEEKILAASDSRRLAMQPEFSRVLGRMRSHGMAVPARLRRLDRVLSDEAAEDRFDNMPV